MRNIKDFEGVVVLTEDDRKENKYEVFEAQLVLGSDRDFHEGLVAVANARKRRVFYESYWGFIDKTGKIVVPTIYKKVGDFSEGLALVVNKNKKYGFIDKTGKVVIPLEYDYAEDFSEGLAYVNKKNVKRGFINKTGEIVIPRGGRKFHDGLARVAENKKYGFIDKTGEVVIPCEYDNAWDFHEGLAMIEKNDKIGFIDKTGKIIIPCDYYESIWITYGCYDGLVRIRENSRFYYFDKTGKNVLTIKNRTREYNWGDHFHEGLAMVAHLGDEGENRRCGFIDKTGEVVIPLEYDNTLEFHEGLVAVRNKKWQWGFIDKTGEVVIPLEYDCVGDFHEGLARAEKHNYFYADDFYYLDKNNKRLSLNRIITDDDNVLTLLEKGDCIRNVKTRYVLEYQGELMLFDSKAEREEYIKSLDESINISPDYCNEESKKYQKVLK